MFAPTSTTVEEVPHEDHAPDLLEKHGLEVGQRVEVDWSAGLSPIDSFTGTVAYATDGHQEIIHVEADDDAYPDGSIHGGTHDAAPEWVKPLDEGDEGR
ncbi:MAG: hypothetical protein ACI9CA_000036 [Natronomonas sp.]|jgi:hypothetical protein